MKGKHGTSVNKDLREENARLQDEVARVRRDLRSAELDVAELRKWQSQARAGAVPAVEAEQARADAAEQRCAHDVQAAEARLRLQAQSVLIQLYERARLEFRLDPANWDNVKNLFGPELFLRTFPGFCGNRHNRRVVKRTIASEVAKGKAVEQAATRRQATRMR